MFKLIEDRDYDQIKELELKDPEEDIIKVEKQKKKKENEIKNR
jgi:hypothetical protein